jgi:hypothetical protein
MCEWDIAIIYDNQNKERSLGLKGRTDYVPRSTVPTSFNPSFSIFSIKT